MKRVVAVLAAVLVVVASGAPARAQGDAIGIVSVDTSAYPTVSLTVTAPPGLAGRDLPADVFTVTEGGEARPASTTRVPAAELQVALVIDVSGSMKGAPLTGAKQAALGFVDALPPGTSVALVAFGDTPVVVAGLTTDLAAVGAAITSLDATGETALYDAVGAGLGVFSGVPPGERSMVVLSDGGDTKSVSALDTVVGQVVASHVRVSVVQLVTGESDAAALEQLAAAGGGQVASAGDPAGLGALYDGLASELVNQFVVVYKSTSHGSTDVAVSVTIDGTGLTAAETLEFPKAGAATPVAGSPPALATVVGPAPPWWESSWLLGVGALALFVAIAVVLMGWALRERPERRLAQEYGISTEDPGAVQWLSGASGGLTSGVQHMLERSGHVRTIDTALEQAGVSIRAGEAVAAALVVSITAAMVGGYLGGRLLALIAAATPVLIGVLVVRYRISRRRSRFADQLGDTLLMLATSLRAGYGLVQAIDAVAREAPAPTSEELSRVVVETRLDRDPNLALADVAARMESKDFDWVVQAISIHRQSGGDLAELLDHVGETIRGRARVERQVKALSAEGKMSGIVLVVLPFVMALLITTANPDYLKPLWGQTAGRIMLAGALALLLAGGLWIRRIVEPHY